MPTSAFITVDAFLVDHRRLEGRAIELLSAWITDERREALDVLLSLVDQRPKYIQVHFLLLMSATEAFHREFLNHPDVSPEEHARRREGALSGCPPEHKAWLSSRLISNEPSFKTRLAEILGSVSDWIDPLVGDRDEFVTKVGNTRNYLVHQDPDGQRRAETDVVRLYWICRVLTLALKFAIVRELGLSAEELTQQLRMNANYGYAREHLQKEPLYRRRA